MLQKGNKNSGDNIIFNFFFTESDGFQRLCILKKTTASISIDKKVTKRHFHRSCWKIVCEWHQIYLWAFSV